MMDENYLEARRLLRETEEQFRVSGGEYWQGRKDGSRLMFAIYQTPERRESIEDVVESSPGRRLFDNEIVQRFMEDCVYNMAAIVYELDHEKRIHPQARLNLRRAVEWYDNMANIGLVKSIDDHCLSSD